jgi:hypothetical protein
VRRVAAGDRRVGHDQRGVPAQGQDPDPQGPDREAPHLSRLGQPPAAVAEAVAMPRPRAAGAPRRVPGLWDRSNIFQVKVGFVDGCHARMDAVHVCGWRLSKRARARTYGLAMAAARR